MSSLVVLDLPEANPRESLTAKRASLERILRGLGSVVVGFSGGIDSTLVAAVAHQELGDRALMVIARSESYPRAELELAESLARSRGWNTRIIDTQELTNPEYRANDGRRCYFCKSELFKHLSLIAEQEGFAHLAYGANVDDMKDWRPGHQAARERRVRSPLQEAGLTKTEIRQLARELDLPNWDKPAMACLSSRVPFGTEVSAETLASIEQAEAVLRNLGFIQYRVRHHGPVARLELDPDGMERMQGLSVRRQVIDGIRAAGYTFVTLDLEGFRSGSMNQLLPGGSEA